MNAFEKMKAKEGDPAVALAELRPLLEYDPLAGHVIWRVNAKFGHYKKGDIAGYLNKEGYVRLEIKGRNHLAHRLAFLFMTGAWPSGQVDHLDGCRANNRWVNLKDTDNRGNSSNRQRHRNGHPVGVTFDKRRGKWHASITDQGIRFFLGYFDTAAEAALTYQLALKDLTEGYAQMEQGAEE